MWKVVSIFINDWVTMQRQFQSMIFNILIFNDVYHSHKTEPKTATEYILFKKCQSEVV